MDADLVNAAAALRWARPDLTAELADHVLEEASSAGHQDRWLAAAGWAVHARVAIGDGRDTACAVLADLPRWGGDALNGAAAQRLRVELAMVAAGAGEVDAARRFLSDVRVDGTDAELAADLLCAHARCAVEDAPDEVAAALDAADAAWGTVGGSAAELGGASVALVRAVVERRAGRPAIAVDHAAEGLARLERGRAGAGRPSSHLAAALAAEWISALLDAGRPAEAADGCNALLPRLSELARPTRQMALLRLTVTRALAAHDPRADTAQLLAQAAEDAAGSDVPDLEAVCRTALGALHEQAGQLDVALEALQLAVGAERRDRDRSRRLLAALAELSEPAEPERPKRRRERAVAPPATTVDDAFSADATTVLPAITRSDRKLRSNRQESQDSPKPRSEPAEAPVPTAAPPAEAQDREPAWEAVPWNGAAGDSPIGDLLIHSLRNGSPGPSENGSGHRNGKSVGPRDHATDEPDASGWVPMLDSGQGNAEQTPVRRRGRFSDADRRRPRRAEDDRDEASAAQEQPRSGRRRARDDNDSAAGAGATDSAATDGAATDGAATDGGAAGNSAARHGDSPGTDAGAGGSGRRSRSSRGARRRAEEPPAGDQPSPELPADTTGEARREAASEATPVSPDATSAESGASDDSGGWLEAALAELDRALSGIGVGASYSAEERPVPEQLPDVSLPEVGMPEVVLPESPLGAERPADDGCVVVIDIARDGRRFAGPRAAAVVRSVADLVADQLPSGARSRFGDSDALVVTRAGWSRGDATGWMHRTLPALLDGFVAAEELPGAQLRVAVHDADGPVGAQLLQPLTDTRAPWADLTTSASEERGQKFRAARAERLEHGSRVRRTEAAEDTDHEGDAQGWPFSGDTQPADVEELSDDRPSGGRHGSGSAWSGGPARGDAGGRGRRHRADDTEDRAGDARRRTDQTQNGATGEPQRTLAGTGRAARRRSAESAAEGSAGSGSVASGSAANGSAANGSATGGSTSNGSTSGGRSTAGRSAAQGSAAGGAEVGGSAGHGSTGNGSAGNGSASSGSAGNGSAGSRSAGNGSAGNGAAGSWPAGTGSSRSRSASDGAASSDSVTSDSVTNTSATSRSGTSRSGSNGAGTNGAGSNGAAGHNATGDGAASGSTSAAAEPERAESTEGLGIADLLAGALAAYRGI